MIIDNVLVIPDDNTGRFTISIAKDGVAWEDLDVTVTIQRQSDSYYWNGTDWQAGIIAMDALEAKPGQYKYINTDEDMFVAEDVFDVSWLAMEDTIKVYELTYETQVIYGITPNKQKVRDAMALTTAEAADTRSIDEKLNLISEEQAIDAGEIIDAIIATEGVIISALEEGHVVL